VDEVDQLESRHGPSMAVRVGLTAAAAAVTATLVAVSWSWHPGRHGSAPTPAGPATNSVDRSAGPTGQAVSPTAAPADAGSVFVQPLPGCLRTDHRHALRIDMAVQNLADQPLQLVSVDIIGRVPGLTLTGQTVGDRPCAAQPRPGGRRIRPTEELVVALDFTLGPTCPRPASVTARLGFLAGGTVLHAETANLVDLAQVCQ